ncbi:DUF4157 domain-containing protein [Streptomyces sp. NPDC059002]|uniref:eCIS core domain-containing protein n=1 Tax=Streptomyces sp. NPDC059002 TaxID=3346690 RepID=UPI0036914825
MRTHDPAKTPHTGPAGSPARAQADGTGPAGASAQLLLALQRSAGNAAVVNALKEQDAAVQRSAVPGVLRTGGRPLDDATRTDMEARLGADFSDVRIHTDSAARASAAEVGARAYTSGNHVVVGDGGADRHTLAHELTHVIQQRRGPVAGTDNGDGLKVSDPGDRFEREAEDNARRALSGTAPAVTDAPAQADTAAAAPSESAPIQRIMRLTDRDRRTYQDTSAPGPEYSYLYHLNSRPLFVLHGAVEQFQAAAANASTRELPDLLGALGPVFVYDAEANHLRPIQLDGREAKGLANFASRNRPAIWQTGGGSRLPDPDGVLIALNVSSRNEAFELLGISAEDQAAFEKVEFYGVHRAEMFEAASQDIATATQNAYSYESPDGSRKVVYGSRVTQARSDTHRIRIGAESIGDEGFDALDPDSPEGQQLTAQFQALPAVTPDTGWVPGTGIRAVDRGAGQDAAMGNWNALAAAAYANRFLEGSAPMNQNWEWLHVRGAQLGGRTEGGNLVPGLYAVNSAMIPWENMIVQWAAQDPERFWARFTADPVPGTPFASNISLYVKAVDHAQLGTLEAKVASFDPMSGKVVDKVAGEIVKRNADQQIRA